MVRSLIKSGPNAALAAAAPAPCRMRRRLRSKRNVVVMMALPSRSLRFMRANDLSRLNLYHARVVEAMDRHHRLQRQVFALDQKRPNTHLAIANCGCKVIPMRRGWQDHLLSRPDAPS